MRAIIDRFEGDMAVILLGDEEIQLDLPRKYLPQKAREGTIMRLSWEIDEAQTESVRDRMRNRIERLKRRDPEK